MMTYFEFYAAKGWHPRQVDELYIMRDGNTEDDEEYWLPVMESASNEAANTWSSVQEKAGYPLSY